MSNLILVRHGQSEWNLENRFTGWVDVDLAPARWARQRLTTKPNLRFKDKAKNRQKNTNT